MITNFLSPLEFSVHVKRLPNTQFFTQAVVIPGVSQNPVETENPYNRLHWKGEKTRYDPLDLSFIVDENMQNWIEIHDWIVGSTSPQEAKQFRDLKESKDGIYTDITISILSSKKNANVNFTFYDCFPFALSNINMDTRSHDVEPFYATASFTYSYYVIENRKTVLK